MITRLFGDRLLAVLGRDMNISVNQEMINDTAKLVMHRLVSRELGRDPSLIESAKVSHARAAVRYAGRSFVREWDELLKLPLIELRTKLVSRDSEMVRLRLSSPFLASAGIDFSDYAFRLRIRRAAKRVAQRTLRRASRRTQVA
jgi:hypothetical protein